MAIDAAGAGCESTNAERRRVLEKWIGADWVVDEASWVGVVDSIPAAVGIGGVGVEGVPAGLHWGDSGRRAVSFNDRRISGGLKRDTTK